MDLETQDTENQIETLKEKIVELKEENDNLTIENLELKETIESYKMFSESVENAYKQAYNKLITN